KELNADAPEKARAAVTTVTAKAPEELGQMPAAQRIELITDLFRGGGVQDKECKTALAKLYKEMPLEPEFKAKDDTRRRMILNTVHASPTIRKARSEWDTLPPAKRIATLKEALKLQCQGLGLKEDEIPPIVKFSEPEANVSEHKTLTCAGAFSTADGKLYLNDKGPAFDDFDRLLDTVMHENTHNYQNCLVARLESDPPTLKPGDPEYNQALLFQLNMGAGYLDGEGEG